MAATGFSDGLPRGSGQRQGVVLQRKKEMPIWRKQQDIRVPVRVGGKAEFVSQFLPQSRVIGAARQRRHGLHDERTLRQRAGIAELLPPPSLDLTGAELADGLQILVSLIPDAGRLDLIGPETDPEERERHRREQRHPSGRSGARAVGYDEQPLAAVSTGMLNQARPFARKSKKPTSPILLNDLRIRDRSGRVLRLAAEPGNLSIGRSSSTLSCTDSGASTSGATTRFRRDARVCASRRKMRRDGSAPWAPRRSWGATIDLLVPRSAWTAVGNFLTISSATLPRSFWNWFRSSRTPPPSPALAEQTSLVFASTTVRRSACPR